MKRILAIIILLFITITFILPFVIKNETQEIESECISENSSIVVIELAELNYEQNAMNEIDIAIAEMENEVESINNIADRMEWFIAYKNIINKYSDTLDPPETIYDVYSEEEIYIMQRCIETETYGCDFLSKVNVANVILNRIEHESFPDNPIDVVTAANQFTYGRENITEDTVLALEYAFMMPDTVDGAIYFHSNSFSETFNGAEWIFTDDAGHHFYK